MLDRDEFIKNMQFKCVNPPLHFSPFTFHFKASTMNSLSTYKDFEAKISDTLRAWLQREDVGIWDSEERMNTTAVYGFNDQTIKTLRPLFEAIHTSFRNRVCFGVDRLFSTQVEELKPGNFVTRIAPPDPVNAPLTMIEVKDNAKFLYFLIESLIWHNKKLPGLLDFAEQIEAVGCFKSMCDNVMGAEDLEEAVYFGCFLTANPLLFSISNSMTFLIKADNVSKMYATFGDDLDPYFVRFDNYIERPFAREEPVATIIDRDGIQSYYGLHNALRLNRDIFRNGFGWLSHVQLHKHLKPLFNDIVPLLWYAMADKYMVEFVGSGSYFWFTFEEGLDVWP